MDKKFSKNAGNQDGIFSYFSQVIIADQDLLFSQFDKVGQFGQNIDIVASVERIVIVNGVQQLR